MNQLAELIGIILGDGYLTNKNRYELKITLDSREKKYTNYIYNLIKNLFYIKPLVYYRKNENTVDIRVINKKLINFLVNNIGLKISPKWNRAHIPKKFMKSYFYTKLLKGLFDTDGSVVLANNNGTIYPRLEIKICPSPMQNQFIKILKELKFHFGVYNIGKGKVRIQLNGKEQLNKWIKLIGSSNYKHIKKMQGVAGARFELATSGL